MQRKSIQIYLLFLGLIFIANESIHGFESIDPLNRLHLVARDNCGMNGAQPHLISGSNWTFAPEEISCNIICNVSYSSFRSSYCFIPFFNSFIIVV